MPEVVENNKRDSGLRASQQQSTSIKVLGLLYRPGKVQCCGRIMTNICFCFTAFSFSPGSVVIWLACLASGSMWCCCDGLAAANTANRSRLNRERATASMSDRSIQFDLD